MIEQEKRKLNDQIRQRRLQSMGHVKDANQLQKDRYMFDHPKRVEGMQTLNCMGFDFDVSWEALTECLDDVEQSIDKILSLES